ncbi:hypothetical protein [Sphingomonas lenta]|uniref:Uncharacterized protein n=1 Tax=Sphingomonas lenta TaxID=1141887 RepID=A0A2A2SJC6_9SPHN|nr:hypothetical protein [Sphingomonas lenta]PAX09333.1 hypothetical protein CKY28_00810 [Sphingomonas lenta]
MSGTRRDSGDDTRGGPEHGRGHAPTDDNKSGGGHTGKAPGGQDSNAHAPGGGVGSAGTPGSG